MLFSYLTEKHHLNRSKQWHGTELLNRQADLTMHIREFSKIHHYSHLNFHQVAVLLDIINNTNKYNYTNYPSTFNVSQSARMFNCELATNGGFFSFKGACEGDTIINGTVVSWGQKNVATFGFLPNATTVIGYVDQQSDFAYTTMLSGNGWLVRDGQSYVKKSREFQPFANSSFVTEKAPRTAVGIDKDGSIILAVVDGVEILDQGLDLFEFAEILIEQGAVHAINLDGGGSTDAVLNGKVWSNPSCNDRPAPFCERPVTTIACIRYPQAQDTLSFLFE